MSGVHVRIRTGGEHYALPVDRVTEVGELGELTPVPGSAPEVLGIRNLRGQVLPVIDLATLLGLQKGDGNERIVVAESGDRRAGLAVESVEGVDDLPDPSQEADSKYLAGVVLVDGAPVGIVELDTLLDALAPAEPS